MAGNCTTTGKLIGAAIGAAVGIGVAHVTHRASVPGGAPTITSMSNLDAFDAARLRANRQRYAIIGASAVFLLAHLRCNR